jgi:hypothetical protein
MSVERGKKATKKVLHEFVREITACNAERLTADDNPAYEGFDDSADAHEGINHSEEDWVRGDAHTASA